jgi:glucokinase
MAERDVLALGVDLGGTKIAAGVFDGLGGLRGRLAVRPTQALGPAEGTVANLFAAIDAALATAGSEASRLGGIGVGTTGPLDPRAGTILEAETLPNLFHFPLRRALEDHYGLRAALSNDANCFALSEATFGAGRGEEIVVGITLGTGCGCGVVIRGRILEGATANAGEVYRALVGERTFDEALSGGGLERLYREGTGRAASGAEVSRLAAAGDAGALAAFASYGGWLARGLGIIAAVLDPGVIVLGGSVASAFPHFEAALRSDIGKYVAPAAARRLRIVPSQQGVEAGARGAAALLLAPG